MIKNNKLIFFGISFVFVIVFVSIPTFVEASYTQISGNTILQVGSKGENVKALQKLLSSSYDIYPSGSQDGSFGPMTKNGVVQFQLAYNLTPDGIVGADTRNKVNSIVSAGRGIDVSNAGIFALSLTASGRNESISFNTNEPVKTAVFYDTNNINWNNWDDKAISLSTPQISGLVNVDDSFSMNKQIILNNLSANTRYNYTITTTDQSGNTSVIWPSTFLSGQ